MSQSRMIPEPERLLAKLLEGEIAEAERAQLNQVLRDDASLRLLYRKYMTLDALLRWEIAPPLMRVVGAGCGARGAGRAVVGSPTIGMGGEKGSGFRVQGPGFSVGAAVELPHQPGTEIPGPEPLVPPIIPDLSPTSHYPLATSHSFVGGPVFSYMVSAVIVGMMLLGAWAYKITHYRQIAENRSQETLAIDRPELVFVGRITGMVDCRWADSQTEAYAGASVPLDRKYALASGLMEITYTTGAKVILQGPCTYEVESRAGGYLSLGKLTAKVETKGSGVRGQGSEKTNPKSPNPKSPDPWSLTPGPLFAVRTPTAIVTDLGTEFGVEVSEDGNTTSHVFRGSVKVKVVGGAGAQKDVVLRKNESARVEKGKGAVDVRMVLPDQVGTPPKFVRRLVEPPKLLDLLDIVAGGNGTGNRRERGIDPYSGLEDPLFVTYPREGKHGFRPVGWHRLIDGVFIPDGKEGPVKVDSAGHAFDGFPPTDGKAWGCIWARAAEVDPSLSDQGWIYKIERPERFMSERRGLLAFHANVGITFNLEAMRTRHAEARPARFRATAGLADVHSRELTADKKVDIWVLVDGRLKQKRTGLRRQDGIVNLDVELSAADRFLALVATDGGDGLNFDSLVIGDPVLEMKPIEEKP